MYVIRSFLIALCLQAVAAAAPPHIVFFLIDDLGSADCGFAGGTEIRTPRIDTLARGGAILDALSVQPVCSPTRSASGSRQGETDLQTS